MLLLAIVAALILLGSTERSPVWVPCLIEHGNVGEVIRLPDLSCVETTHFAGIYQAQSHHLNDTRRNRWSSPTYFTIPVLSPFTSVVRPFPLIDED
jgi:hypothetical protein